MTSRDIVRIARQRAGLTQRQLADRSGHPRESIARWETGAREPSLATLQTLVEACGLDLVTHLARLDHSLEEAAADQLALAPVERLRRMLPPEDLEDALRALRWLARAMRPSVVVGDLAAVLQGGPQRPRSAAVEFVSDDPTAMDAELRRASLTPIDGDERWRDVYRTQSWRLDSGGVLALVSNIPATRDYRDLRRAAPTVVLDGAAVHVAHPRDLLRIADASQRENDWARRPGLRALLARVSDAEAA